MAEYEACILGLKMAINMNVHELLVIGDSDLLIHQVLGEWAVKNAKITPYVRYMVRAIANLQREFPNVNIVYGDFYGAILSLIRNPSSFGFNQNTLLSACCGTGGRHNFNFRTVCGAAGINACANPAQYVHWDGIHLTDEAHRRITEVLVRDMLAKFNCVV
ncbi:GDSL esterase/lipase At1g28590-like [Solanum stenotomum]|uniref:GDSL esterase/lipase At1g28590-like n=1 Tax=Solanum stenotomum TaxID=172797 RepID=UPI0020D081CB|nr:GDSL esterase/lipase At1g28590-like [Solanum stenotomum]